MFQNKTTSNQFNDFFLFFLNLTIIFVKIIIINSDAFKFRPSMILCFKISLLVINLMTSFIHLLMKLSFLFEIINYSDIFTFCPNMLLCNVLIVFQNKVTSSQLNGFLDSFVNLTIIFV